MLDRKHRDREVCRFSYMVYMVLTACLLVSVIAASQGSKTERERVRQREGHFTIQGKILKGQRKSMRQQNRLPIWDIPVSGQMMLKHDNYIFTIGQTITKINKRSGEIIWSITSPVYVKDACLTPKGDLCIIGTIHTGFETNWITVKIEGTNGNIVWQSIHSGSGVYTWDEASAISVDEQGNVYVIGHIEDVIGFGFLLIEWNICQLLNTIMQMEH